MAHEGLDRRIGAEQNTPAPSPVNWDVSLASRDGSLASRDRIGANRADGGVILVAAADQVPVIDGTRARQGAYPTTVNPVDVEIIRRLLHNKPSLARLAGSEVFEQFLNNYHDRSNELSMPHRIPLWDASTHPALKEKAGWAASTDPGLYQADPNLQGVLEGRFLKPNRDTEAASNAKNPDGFYVMGYDKQNRPVDVIEYFKDDKGVRCRAQYLFKYEHPKEGMDVVSIFKYHPDDVPRGYDNSDAAGTIPIGANHHANRLEGMTQYFMDHGQTYLIRKWDGSTMKLGDDELSATPIPSDRLDADGKPIPAFPPIQQIYFKDRKRDVGGNIVRTIGEGEGEIVLGNGLLCRL